MSYTKGPWEMQTQGVSAGPGDGPMWLFDVVAHGQRVASIEAIDGQGESDARAIAALPQLLEAAQQVLGYQTPTQRSHAMSVLSTAVAEALGEEE